MNKEWFRYGYSNWFGQRRVVGKCDVRTLQRTIKGNEPGTMRIWIYVPIHVAALFELQLEFRGVNGPENMWRRAYDMTMSGDLGDVNVSLIGVQKSN